MQCFKEFQALYETQLEAFVDAQVSLAIRHDVNI